MILLYILLFLLLSWTFPGKVEELFAHPSGLLIFLIIFLVIREIIEFILPFIISGTNTKVNAIDKKIDIQNQLIAEQNEILRKIANEQQTKISDK